MPRVWDIPVRDSTRVRDARVAAEDAAAAAGLDERRTAAAALVATELATNLLKHAQGGQVLIEVVAPPALREGRGESRVVQIAALDHGPGIPDVPAALGDGFSTTRSLGAGLGTCLRLADDFHLHSAPGRGTVAVARIGSAPGGTRPAARRGPAGRAEGGPGGWGPGGGAPAAGPGMPGGTTPDSALPGEGLPGSGGQGAETSGGAPGGDARGRDARGRGGPGSDAWSHSAPGGDTWGRGTPGRDARGLGTPGGDAWSPGTPGHNPQDRGTPGRDVRGLGTPGGDTWSLGTSGHEDRGAYGLGAPGGDAPGRDAPDGDARGLGATGGPRDDEAAFSGVPGGSPGSYAVSVGGAAGGGRPYGAVSGQGVSDRAAVGAMAESGRPAQTASFGDGARARASYGGVWAGGVNVPYGGGAYSGDAWAWVRSGERLTLMLADGLGHGSEAARASTAAVQAMQRSAHLTPAEALRQLHGELGGTRGAAVAVAQVDLRAGRLRFAGIGNVGARLYEGGTWRALLSRPGIVGVHRPATLREEDVAWADDRLLILHTDGLPSRWTPPSDPGLLAADPAVTAAVTIRDASSSARPVRDDTAVAVLTPTPPDLP